MAVLPMPCEEDQGVYSISVVSERGNTIIPQCPSQLSLLSFLGVPYKFESESSLANDWNSMNRVNFEVESAEGFSSCSVDIDAEEKSFDMLKSEEQTVCCSVKTESALTRAFKRKIGMQIVGKIMQLLLNQSLTLRKSSSNDKSVTERAYETHGSKWRRYKRAASLDSRTIVIFFSVLSSMGTLFLIYLTLRVKQMDDRLVHA